MLIVQMHGYLLSEIIWRIITPQHCVQLRDILLFVISDAVRSFNIIKHGHKRYTF